jgi:hypothetical protein
MTQYFSRLAQRCGSPAQGARRAAAVATVDAGAHRGADHGDRGGYEQERFVEVAPAAIPAAHDPARDAGLATPAAAASPASQVPSPALSAPPSSAPARAPAPDPVSIERDDVRRIDPYRVDPYRNDPEDDDAPMIEYRTIARSAIAVAPTTSSFPGPASAAAVPSQRSPDEPRPGDHDRFEVDAVVFERRADAPPTASAADGARRFAPPGTREDLRDPVRARAPSGERIVAVPGTAVDAGLDADVEAFETREIVRAAAATAAARADGAATVRAQSPRSAGAEPAPTPVHRPAQGVHVHIGRIELEVIAPPPRAAHAPVAPPPAPAPAPPARESAFNPHRHYLRGR